MILIKSTFKMFICLYVRFYLFLKLQFLLRFLDSLKNLHFVCFQFNNIISCYLGKGRTWTQCNISYHAKQENELDCVLSIIVYITINKSQNNHQAVSAVLFTCCSILCFCFRLKIYKIHVHELLFEISQFFLQNIRHWDYGRKIW